MNRLQFAQPDKLAAKLLRVLALEKRASTRVQRATTLLRKYQRTRERLTKKIGETEVQRIVNSDEAYREITARKNTVRRTVNRLTGGQHNETK